MLFSEIIAFGIELAVRYLCYFIWLPISLVATWIAKLLKRSYTAGRDRHQQNDRRRYTAEQKKRSTKDACGLLPPSVMGATAEKKETGRKALREGRKVENGSKKETIQSVASDARSARRFGSRVHRRICK